MPAMNVVLRGSASWSAAGFAKTGIVSVHQGHQSEIELTDDDRATGIWAMSDRLFMPAGMPFSLMTGYWHYHETYEKPAGMRSEGRREEKECASTCRAWWSRYI